MCASENMYESGGTSLEHLNSYPPSPALEKLSSVARREWPAHPLSAGETSRQQQHPLAMPAVQAAAGRGSAESSIQEKGPQPSTRAVLESRS